MRLRKATAIRLVVIAVITLGLAQVGLLLAIGAVRALLERD